MEPSYFLTFILAPLILQGLVLGWGGVEGGRGGWCCFLRVYNKLVKVRNPMIHLLVISHVPYPMTSRLSASFKSSSTESSNRLLSRLPVSLQSTIIYYLKTCEKFKIELFL